MLTGRGVWRHHPKQDREQAILDVLGVFLAVPSQQPTFPASVVKKASVSPKDPVEVAFEQLASRFDQYLMRLHKSGNTQRGIIIFDKSTYEDNPPVAGDPHFRTIGHTWGIIRKFAEVPLF